MMVGVLVLMLVASLVAATAEQPLVAITANVEVLEAAMDSDAADLLVVLFTRPGCGPCERMAEALHDALRSSIRAPQPTDVSLSIFVHDVAPDNSVAVRLGVRSFPTLAAFRGHGEEFRVLSHAGIVTAAEVGETLDALRTTPSTEIRTVASVRYHLHKAESTNGGLVVVLGLYHLGDANFGVFINTCEALRGEGSSFLCLHSHHESMFASFKHKGTFLLWNYAWQPEPFVFRADPSNRDDALTFAARHGLPLVGLLSPWSRPLYLRLGRATLYLFLGEMAADPGIRERLAGMLVSLAHQYHDLSFVMVGSDAPELVEQFAAEGQVAQREVAYGIVQGSTKWRPSTFGRRQGSTLLDLHALETFLQGFIRNQLSPFLLGTAGEPSRPEDRTSRVVGGSGRVMELDPSTFGGYIDDRGTNLFITLYANWCSFCAEMMPELDKVAQSLAGDETTVVAKLEASRMELPSRLQAAAFPTIYFVDRRWKGAPQLYTGPRTAEAMLEFIAEKLSSS